MIGAGAWKIELRSDSVEFLPAVPGLPSTPVSAPSSVSTIAPIRSPGDADARGDSRSWAITDGIITERGPHRLPAKTIAPPECSPRRPISNKAHNPTTARFPHETRTSSSHSAYRIPASSTTRRVSQSNGASAASHRSCAVSNEHQEGKVRPRWAGPAPIAPERQSGISIFPQPPIEQSIARGLMTLDIWQENLGVGMVLPTMPLWPRGNLCLPVDLESTYDRTCREHRITA